MVRPGGDFFAHTLCRNPNEPNFAFVIEGPRRFRKYIRRSTYVRFCEENKR
jgi:hypothetical protein